MITEGGGGHLQLYIKQRIFSWTDRYDVYDEDGNVRYEVRSALFSLGHQIHVYDQRREEGSDEVGYIREKPFSLMPTFEIVVDGRVQGVIRKRFSLLRENYEVDYRHWRVEGDFLGWDYRVMESGQEIMRICKEFWHWSDTYTLRYADARHEVPGLLLVLAIDAANCSHND